MWPGPVHPEPGGPTHLERFGDSPGAAVERVGDGEQRGPGRSVLILVLSHRNWVRTAESEVPGHNSRVRTDGSKLTGWNHRVGTARLESMGQIRQIGTTRSEKRVQSPFKG